MPYPHMERRRIRLDLLNDTAGVRFARFDDDLAITASGPLEHAEAALWDAVKLALSLSFSDSRDHDLSEPWR